MDLGAVKEAPVRELARGAVAAARNARGLVEDAELLSGAGRQARSYSLAGLAVEEVGKAGILATLAAMPVKGAGASRAHARVAPDEAGNGPSDRRGAARRAWRGDQVCDHARERGRRDT